RNVFVPGPAGDDGAAAGAALYASLAHGGERNALGSLALGPAYSDEDIEVEVRKRGLVSKFFSRHDEVCDEVAGLLERGQVVGWFQGRMEYGPRSLGNRAILADARRPEMKNRLNRLKSRADFHPFACSVLEESASGFFDIPAGKFPYMTFCFPVKAAWRDSIPAVV